jgi:hypothetical protein
MRTLISSGQVWPAAKAAWHRSWGIWLIGEPRYSKDFAELLDILDM